MKKPGTMGVTLILSLILSVALFTSSAFARSSSYGYRDATVHNRVGVETLARANLMRQSFSIQRVGSPRASDQQTNYQQDTQNGDTCNWSGDCQHDPRCTHIFRSPWGWIFICRGW
ncbi:MAG: hypothetical protein ACRDHW_09135 [Ktedonobacteraceae bacterium]